MKLKKILATALLGASSLNMMGSGYEKVVLWSAKNSGMANSGASSMVSGADAVYYNPAGLSWGSEGKLTNNNWNDHQVSVNFSPTRVQFEGAVVSSARTSESDASWLPISALLASHRINNQWAVGYGFYTAGGTVAKHSNVDFTSVSSQFSNYRPNVKADITLTEFALSGGYQINSNFSVGAAWRVLMVRGEFASAKVSYLASNNQAVAMSGVEVKDLKDEKYNGFRLGMQYKSDDRKWGMGLTYRSSVTFKATGATSGGVIYTSVGQAVMASQSVTVSPNTLYALNQSGSTTVENSLPDQLTLGGYYNLTSAWTLAGELAWTNYSKNNEVRTAGSVVDTSSGATTALPNTAQGWKDMYQMKLGAEYEMQKDLTLRGGYALTSQVTSSTAAKATFSAPGLGHTFTFGGSKGFKNNSYFLDLAAEYSVASKSGQTADESTNALLLTPPMTGKFVASAMGIHAALKINF